MASRLQARQQLLRRPARESTLLLHLSADTRQELQNACSCCTHVVADTLLCKLEAL